MPFIGGFRAVGFTQSKRRYPAFIEGLGSIAGTDFVRHDGTTPLSGDWDVGSQEITNLSRLIVGSTIDQGAICQVKGAVGNQLELRDNDNVTTRRLGFLTTTHFDQTRLPLGMIMGDADSFFSRILIGGGHASLNATERISMFATAADPTPTGTEIQRTTIVGTRHEIGVTSDPADLFQVESAVGTALLVRDVDNYVDFQSTTIGIGLPKIAGDPAVRVDGDLWYDTVSDDLQFEASSLTEKVVVSRYAEIFVQGGSSAQAITTGGTFEKFVGFTTNADSDGITGDAANDKITVTRPGRYLVAFQISFTGTGNAIVEFQLRWAGSSQTQIACRRQLDAGGDVGSASMFGIVDAVSAPTDLEIWFTTDGDGNLITAVDAQLTATWLGTT
jgi:hypothetical protein